MMLFRNMFSWSRFSCNSLRFLMYLSSVCYWLLGHRYLFSSSFCNNFSGFLLVLNSLISCYWLLSLNLLLSLLSIGFLVSEFGDSVSVVPVDLSLIHI